MIFPMSYMTVFATSPRKGSVLTVPAPCRYPLVAHVFLAGGPAVGHRGPAQPLEAVQLSGGSSVHLLLR